MRPLEIELSPIGHQVKGKKCSGGPLYVVLVCGNRMKVEKKERTLCCEGEINPSAFAAV